MTNSSLTKTFFEKFELFSDAPGAVSKMRELVLELAVRGHLSERRAEDHDDPVWSAFLRQFECRTSGSDPGLTGPFEIPTEWRWICMDDAADTCGQKKPDSPFTYIDVSSIDNVRGVIKSELEVIPPDKAPSRARKLIRQGTVIYATVRPYLKNIAIVDREFVPEAIVSTAFAILHPRPFIEARFLFYWLRSESFASEVAVRMKGVAYPAINDGEFRGCPLPLPPIAEQKRIVVTVDELMALCDRLEAQQQERETRHATLARASLARFADAPTPVNLDFLFHNSYTIDPADLRKSILTLAVQGKLVPQDPNDEPAEECLSRLGLKSNALLRGSEGEEDDTLPHSWARVLFEDVAIIAGGVTLGRKLGDRKTVNLPYLRVANVKRGEIDLSVVKEVAIAENEVERYALRENDLLMTEGGDWDKVGRAAIWRAEIPVCLHQNHVFRARMRSNELTPIWFERYFNSPMGRGYFESASKQTTNLASINMRQVRNCPIPFPPVAEQRRIVAKVEELMALVDDLESQLAASRATASRLLDAIVAEVTALD
jgi:type I restriction enzyme S subunit